MQLFELGTHGFFFKKKRTIVSKLTHSHNVFIHFTFVVPRCGEGGMQLKRDSSAEAHLKLSSH